MELASYIFVYASIAILGLLALLFLTPLRLYMQGGRETGWGWVVGYAGVPLRILGLGIELRESSSNWTFYVLTVPVWKRPFTLKQLMTRKKKPEKEKEEKRNRRIPDASDVFYLVRTPNLISVAGRLFSLLNPKGEMECDLGFNDPSATGILAAVVAFLTSFAPGVQERIRFNYLEAELRGYLRLGMLVWLPQLFVGGVAIALGEDGRELVIHLWGLRRRRAARVA